MMKPLLSLTDEFGHYHLWWRRYCIEGLKTGVAVSTRLSDYNAKTIKRGNSQGSTDIEFNTEIERDFFILKHVK